MKFTELNLQSEILQAISDLEFENLMPVQEEVIPILLNKNIDIIALAQTGTGKTATFGIPIIQNLDYSKKETEALILAPTRELCVQIANDLISYAKYIPQATIVAVYGGANIETQIKKIKKGAKIIVATPGRMLDLINRNVIDISNINVAVLDEADEMLTMGFQESLNAILAETPKNKNTWLFSATMPTEVENIAHTYMTDPTTITIGSRNAGAENVEHYYYMVRAKDRYLALKRIVDYYPNIYGIIFCRTRKETQEVADNLIKDGYNADSLHGDLSQTQRDHVMNKFRNKNLQLLVATDVAARGLDVYNLSHVINYNLPDESEQYVHRSGRTGRADKNGISISILNLRENHKIKQIEKIVKKEFLRKEIPSGKEICKKQLFKIINEMQNVDVSSYSHEIEEFLPIIYNQLEWFSKEEIIKRFVAIEFNRFLKYYKDAEDINVSEKEIENNSLKPKKEDFRNLLKNSKKETKNKNNKKDFDNFNGDFVTLVINIGRNTGTVPQRIIGIINDTVKKRNIKIGHIDIFDRFSTIEVDANYAQDIIEAFYYRDDGRYIVDYYNEQNFPKSSKEKSKKSKQKSTKGKSKKKKRR
jgi:ATP-dependent RNA helicase DeaD